MSSQFTVVKPLKNAKIGERIIVVTIMKIIKVRGWIFRPFIRSKFIESNTDCSKLTKTPRTLSL